MSMLTATPMGVFPSDIKANAKIYQNSAVASPAAPTAAAAIEPLGKKRKSVELQDGQQPQHLQSANKMRLKETLTGSSVNNRPPLAMKPPKAMPVFPTSSPFPMSPIPFGILPTPMPAGPPLPAGMTWGVPAPPPALLMSMMSAMSGGYPNPMGFPFPMPPMAGPVANNSVPAPGLANPFLTPQMAFNPMMPTLLGSCLQPSPAQFISSCIPEPTNSAPMNTLHAHTAQPIMTSNTSSLSPRASSGTEVGCSFTTSHSTASPSLPFSNVDMSGAPGSPQSVSTTAASAAVSKSPLVVSVPTNESPAALVSPSTADSSASDFFNFAKNSAGLMGTTMFDQLPTDVTKLSSSIGDIASSLQSPRANTPLPLPHLSPVTAHAHSDAFAAVAVSPDASSATPASYAVGACNLGTFELSAVNSPVTDSGDSSFTDGFTDFGVMGDLEDAALINMDCLFEDDLDLSATQVDLGSLGLNLKKTGSFADLIGDALWCNSTACSAS